MSRTIFGTTDLPLKKKSNITISSQYDTLNQKSPSVQIRKKKKSGLNYSFEYCLQINK